MASLGSSRLQPQLSIRLDSACYTYGDAVRGYVVLTNPQRVLMEILEMQFHGECGTDITYTKEVPTGSFGCTTVTANANEKRDLFTHTRTITQVQRFDPGVQKYEFDFRFPRRDEVRLAPNSDPLTATNSFYFDYQITAKASIKHTETDVEEELNAARPLMFISSREYTNNPIPYGFYGTLLTPSQSIGSRIFSKANSKEPHVLQLVDTELRAVVSTPERLIAKDPFSLLLELQTHPRLSGLQPGVKSVRLSKFRICLRSRVKLTAKGNTVELDLSKNEPVQIGSWSARTRQEALEITLGQPLDLGKELNLICPHYIRTTFCNELVKYEYVFRVRADFDFCGRTYTVKYDDIPVELQPQFVREDVDEWDYASSPPEGEEPPPWYEVQSPDSPFSAASSAPPTPPPTFEEVMSMSLEPPPFSLDSLTSIVGY